MIAYLVLGLIFFLPHLKSLVAWSLKLFVSKNLLCMLTKSKAQNMINIVSKLKFRKQFLLFKSYTTRTSICIVSIHELLKISKGFMIDTFHDQTTLKIIFDQIPIWFKICEPLEAEKTTASQASPLGILSLTVVFPELRRFTWLKLPVISYAFLLHCYAARAMLPLINYT